MKIFVISPHRDDAAFSLSIAIGHWLAQGHTVQIVNVFTHSLYAPCSDAERVSAEDRANYVSLLRKREDERFLQAMQGMTMSALELDDAPIRLGCDSSQVCSIAVSAEDPAFSAIQDGLQSLLGRDEACLVLPLGLGRHVDHCTARDAALDLAVAMPCAFYEDLPYAARQGVRDDLLEFRNRVRCAHLMPISPVLCYGALEDAVDFKQSHVLLYTSQIELQEAEPIAGFCRRYGGGERLWANAKWIAVAEALSLSTCQIDPEGYPLPA